MRIIKILISAMTFLQSVFCLAQTSNTILDLEAKRVIDNYLRDVIEVNQIPGLAFAVVKDGDVCFERYYGKASLEENTPVNENSIFGIFSTTKLISTIGIFQLIEKGKLNIDDKISKYFGDLPTEWRDIRIKNLLTHSSGLPDLVRFEDIPSSLPDYAKMAILSQKPMEFETGNQFSYNQTNYWLLAQIIEKVTGMTFDDYILKNQFPTSKKGVLFSSDATEHVPNRADKYDFDNKQKKYIKSNINDGISAHSGNGMNITLQEFVRWNKNLDNDFFFTRETKQSMWRSFDFANKRDNFLYGWGVYMVNGRPSYGFSGGNVTAFRKFVEERITIIYLSNGYKYFDIQDQVVNHVAGLVDKKLIDPYSLAEEQITYEFLENKFKKAEQTYKSIKKDNPDWNFEGKLNSIGYALMRNDRPKDAIEVFELNANENPKSGNAFDSLAEGYFSIGEFGKSKDNYQKSLELDPTNNNAKAMIQEIEKHL